MEDIEGVFVVAISSRPDLIDPAIVRPGRIDQHIRCDIPGEDDRFEYLRRNFDLVKLDSKLTTDPEKYESFVREMA